MRNTSLALCVATLAIVLGGAPSAARACGGFFCNLQAIDQSGENILFVQNDDGTVSTVVQILYEGPSEEFAWILPVPAEPTVTLGSAALFEELWPRTVPRFTNRTETVGTCRSTPSCPSDYSGWTDASAASDASSTTDAGTPPPTVDVRLRTNVGPFDVAVLSSGSGDALRAWLSDNGYVIPEEAGAELDHYVALDHFFVALRLQKDRSSGEIQPIVLTSANDEPCIPIRLTRIAATPDMPLTVYFLGEQRARPLNYLLLEADLDDEGLWRGTTSYFSSVTRTVDAAGGRAFVTDYAGDTPSFSIELPSVEALRGVDDPVRFLEELWSRGHTADAQLLPLLVAHMPPLEGYSAEGFYNCVVSGLCLGAAEDWSAELTFTGADLVDAIEAAIVVPRREAQRMLDSQPHLTRLFTTISPDEMTVDPQFATSSELPRVHSRVHEAVLRTDCSSDYFAWSAPRRLILPTGREIVQSEGVAYAGTDEEYCEDRGFRPGQPDEELESIAAERHRAIGATAGGVCSVRPGVTETGGPAILGLVLVALAVRRRRR